jgi:ubiquinone biosynthesis protein
LLTPVGDKQEANMNIWNLHIGQQIRELSRLRHIAEILARNGLGMLLDQTELGRFLPRGWRRKMERPDRDIARMSIPERVRHTLEDLGPTYIKLGQLLSGRGDLLPAGYIEELTKLLDSAPPFPYEDVVKIVSTELGQPPEVIFDLFEHTPVAAASIGQVHRAVLHNGDRVVAKVQRPNIEKTVRSDLDLLLRQARFLERRSEAASSYNMVENIEELTYSLMNELDYTSEAQNIDRFYQAYADDPNLRIPKVYWEYTTKRLVVMEEIEGIPLTDLDRLRREGYNLPAIAEIGTDFYLRQIFEDGFFHADPHPANIMVAGNQFAPLDFGMVGFLPQRMREDMGDMLVGVITQNTEQVVTVMVRMGIISRATNLRELERDLNRMLIRYLGLPLQQMDIGQILGEVLSISFMHHIRLPADLAMLIRTMIILNGLGRKLDPDYQLVPTLEPFVRQLVQDKLSVKRIGGNALRSFTSINTLIQRLPNRLDDLWDQLDDGDLTVGVSVRDLRMIIQRVDRIANRMAFAIIVAALIIGSALILMGGTQIQALFQIPGLNLAVPVAQVSFILAGLTGAWLLWSIIRSRGM